MVEIGRRSTLGIVRESTPGLYLDGENLGEILLPKRYIPKNIQPGDKMDVFIYLDSEDRLVATTEHPLAQVGDILPLRVLSVNQNVGAFLDWGLSKDLLLPFREQLNPVRPGQMVVVAVSLDSKSNRIIASARLRRYLKSERPHYTNGQPVEIMITDETPLGYNALVENSHVGLLYRDKVAAPMRIGQKLNAFVRNVTEGGKIDLTLDPSGGYKRVSPLTHVIIRALEANGGQLPYDDSSPPEAIRDAFGVSKKVFKQALGSLFKNRRIEFQKPGIALLQEEEWEPGKSIKPAAPVLSSKTSPSAPQTKKAAS